jgi:hypothetical protein
MYLYSLVLICYLAIALCKSKNEKVNLCLCSPEKPTGEERYSDGGFGVTVISKVVRKNL